MLLRCVINYLHSLFIPDRPNNFGEAQGLQYGGDDQPLSRAGPRPIRDPFKDKTYVLIYSSTQNHSV